jgi:hypothetical protein
MLSTPPAMTQSIVPDMTARAAKCSACCDEPHCQSMVTPGTAFGSFEASPDPHGAALKGFEGQVPGAVLAPASTTNRANRSRWNVASPSIVSDALARR